MRQTGSSLSIMHNQPTVAGLNRTVLRFSMWHYLQTPPARAVLWGSFALILSVVAWYVVRRFRDQTEHDGDTSAQLTKFREMKRQGVLSDAEFRTIKTVLGAQVQNELNGDKSSS